MSGLTHFNPGRALCGISPGIPDLSPIFRSHHKMIGMASGPPQGYSSPFPRWTRSRLSVGNAGCMNRRGTQREDYPVTPSFPLLITSMIATLHRLRWHRLSPALTQAER
jgi:hypothetical protein